MEGVILFAWWKQILGRGNGSGKGISTCQMEYRPSGFFQIIVFNHCLFAGFVECLMAVEISGGVNDFAIWKGHLPASCLPGKFAYIRLLGPGNLLPWWNTIYDSGGITKWKSLAKNPQLMIQQWCTWCGWEQSPSSKGPLLVLYLRLALHCWPHSSPSGKRTSPADHWLVAPGA